MGWRPVVPDDEEKEAGERGYCSSLCYLFFSPYILFFFPFFSRQRQSSTLSFLGSAGGCSRCYWWRWRGRNSSGAQRVRTVFLLPCAEAVVSVFPSPRLFSLSLFFFFVSVACFPLFSKKILPRLLLFPCIYRQQGERFTIPFPSAGHDGVGWLLCSCCRAWASSSFIVVVGYGGYGQCRVSWASGVVEKEKLSGKRRFKIFFSPATTCARKKENTTVQNGTVSMFFFFFKKRKCNLKKPKNGL